MANKQTLPNMTDVQGSYVNTRQAPQMPSINYRSPLRDVAGVVEQAEGFAKTYTDLRYEQYEAEGTKLLADMAHEIEDSTDPCQLQDIKNAYDEKLKNIGGDDFFAKNYRNSQYFTKFKNRWDIDTERMYLQKMHSFEEIQAEATGQQIANAIATTSDPAAINGALQSYNAALSRVQHLSAEKKLNLLQGMLKTTLGNAVANNPDTAEAFINQYGEQWGKYGLNTTDVLAKADNRKRALRAEARQEEAHQRLLMKEARDAKTAQMEAQIIKNPEKAEQILAEAATIDNKLFVNVSDWYRKGIGKKDSKIQSPYVKAFIEAEDKDAYVKENLDALGDSSYRAAVNFYYQRINKEDKTDEEKEEAKTLNNGMEAAAKEGQKAYEDYVDEHFAEISTHDSTRSTRNDLNKHFGIKGEDSYLDMYINELNAREDWALDDIKAERSRLNKNTILDSASKNKVYAWLDRKQTSLENAQEKANKKVEKEEEQKQKAIEKQTVQAEKDEKARRKEDSEKAYGEVLTKTPDGSEAFNDAFVERLPRLNTTERNKLIKEYNSLIDKEHKGDEKAAKEAKRSLQKENYRKFNQQINDGTLTDPDVIDKAVSDGLLSNDDAVKLENKLSEANKNKSIMDEKDLIKADRMTIYSNSEKGIITPEEELKSGDWDVLRLRNSENNKTAENNYKKGLAEITSEIYDNLPDADKQAEYVNKLIALNLTGTHSPEEDVQKIINQVNNADFDKYKNLKTKLYNMMGNPLRGKEYSAYEMELRKSALDEAQKFVKDKGRSPTEQELSEIAGKYMPTLSGLNAYRDTRDSAYYNLLSESTSLFEPTTYQSKKEGVKISTYRLNPNYKFSDFDNYNKRLEQARTNLTDSQYKELYKPVAMYMGDIIRRAQSDSTIEAYAMQALLRDKYSNKIDNPTAIYEDYRKVMDILEQQGAQRSANTGWIFGTTKSDVDAAVKTLFNNSQQLQGNGARR